MNESSTLFAPNPPLCLGLYSLSMSLFLWKPPSIVGIFRVLPSSCEISSCDQFKMPNVYERTGGANRLCACTLLLALNAEFHKFSCNFMFLTLSLCIATFYPALFCMVYHLLVYHGTSSSLFPLIL